MFLLARLLLALVAFAAAAHAGTPLICHPYAIGAAASLPGSDGDWKGVNPAYDRTKLVGDTLALLTPETPLLVRMETLRRAAIYATAGLRGWGTRQGIDPADKVQIAQLTAQLEARLAGASGRARGLALFDAGFLAETIRHTGIDGGAEGYARLLEARDLLGADPAVDFALALASSWPRNHADRALHLSRARAAAAPDSPVARNLLTHFGDS